MLSPLGKLRYPFLSAAGAIMVLTFTWFARDQFGYSPAGAIVSTLFVGGLLVVVLYALMRSLSAR